MLLAVGLLAGCASANVNPSGGDDDTPDAPTSDNDGSVDPDGPPAEPVEATLQQTTNTTVAAQNSVACALIDGGTGGIIRTNANSWYRVYSLAEAGINGAFAVSKVSFAVELANNEPPLTVKVGTYSGTPDDNAPLNLGLATFLATTTAPVANTQTPITIDAPIAASIPAGSNLIVEITSTDRPNDGEGFLMGTTNGPFQHTNYLMATECGINEPRAMANVCTGCGDSQAIMSVTGTH